MIDLNLNPSRKELKAFSIGLVIFGAIVGGIVYRHSEKATAAVTIIAITTTLGVIGFLAPALIRYVYVPWVVAAYPIGWTVSHLVMAAIFYGLITPMGLVMRLCGRDPMRRAFDRSAKTYWIARPTNQATNRYFRQF